MSDLALSVLDLSKSYGEQKAVSHASFAVPFGTICGFVGPNGSGKTTTMRMLLGLITPTGGNAHVLGEPISHPERYLDRVGAMIEGPAFYPALSGAENLRVLATLGGLSIDRVQGLLDRVGLGDRANSKYKTYSLGMKQRLGIAAALLPTPQLLLLDEPTNGLDPAGIQEVRELLRSLADDGTTVFVSSHLLSEIETISDSLVMLRKGDVIFAGKTQELLLQQQPTIIAKSADPKDLLRLLEIAHHAGHEGSIVDGVARILGPTEWAVTLNKLAFDSGIILSQLSPVLPSLEATFFEMTGDPQ
ncbi:MAG TPA: ATP-binding cassette domain-containing protein [Candidatus Paceibacterota bacterium]|nr:ATP-binding cassette domain-containing protein [Candidatus Paceibacterota bacterium]